MRWYNLYSYWVIILVILSYLRLIKFSVMPSVIGALIGTIIVSIAKLYFNIPVSIPIVLYMLILHSIPFAILPIAFTKRDIYINAVIFLLYLLFLEVQNLDIGKVYYKVLYTNLDVSIDALLKERGLY